MYYVIFWIPLYWLCKFYKTISFSKRWVSLQGNSDAGGPQLSILGPLLFFIYINNLSDDMLTKTMLSAGENYLFSVMHNINTSAANLNK